MLQVIRNESAGLTGRQGYKWHKRNYLPFYSMDLPVYELVISNEETSDVEVSFVALVDKPAIERNFLHSKMTG